MVTQPPPVTLAPGVTLPVGETLPPVDTTIAPTTTAVACSTRCRTARPTRWPAPAAPVELTFWHGMNGPLAEELGKLADAYNASQSKVHVT